MMYNVYKEIGVGLGVQETIYTCHRIYSTIYQPRKMVFSVPYDRSR